MTFTEVPPGRSYGFVSEYPEKLNRIYTQVIIYAAFTPSFKPIEPERKIFTAVWDTGADTSAVSRKVVEMCNLKSIATKPIITVMGTEVRNVYSVNITLPNRVVLPEIKVIEGHGTSRYGDEGYDVIIGMDVIGQGDFLISHGNGKTVFSFRIPSTEMLTFEKLGLNPKHELIQAPFGSGQAISLGRNHPCHCGSGMKYKKCCGKSAHAPGPVNTDR